jgi:hypothetical protein
VPNENGWAGGNQVSKVQQIEWEKGWSFYNAGLPQTKYRGVEGYGL